MSLSLRVSSEFSVYGVVALPRQYDARTPGDRQGLSLEKEFR